jgi:hypothetical protein
MGLEQPGFYSKEDLRSENRELALKLFFRELKALTIPIRGMSGCMVMIRTPEERLNDLLVRWGVREEEIGTRLSLAISFPEGVVRNQWFYGPDGKAFSLKHDGKPAVKKAVKKPSKKKSR